MLIAKSSQYEGQGEANHDSEYIGEPNKRQEFVLKLVREIPIQMGYSVKLYVFNDLEGNELVWFASRDSNDLDLDCTYRIKATIKTHREYRGTKQTLINRLKIIGPYIAPVEKPRTTDAQMPIHETRESIADIWNDL